MKISPSMLASDFARLGEELKKLEAAGADYVHLDVMDGLFVPNLTFGAPVIKSLRKITKIPFDVHLMIHEPHRYIKDFSDAGADIITFHAEAESDIIGTIDLIRRYGKKVGISLKPGTAVEKIFPYLKLVDLALVMTVEPGFGGQKFMSDMMGKVECLKAESRRQKTDILIEVDGGINEETAKIAKRFGADIAVAGTSVFKSGNFKDAIDSLR